MSTDHRPTPTRGDWADLARRQYTEWESLVARYETGESGLDVAISVREKALIEAVPHLLTLIDRAAAVSPSRLGAGDRIRDLVANGDGVDVAFYAGASFALAKVSRALRGEQP